MKIDRVVKFLQQWVDYYDKEIKNCEEKRKTMQELIDNLKAAGE